jgi:hypothetical protein
VLSDKSEILFKWNEPWPYAWFRCKRDIANLFTLKTPQGIVVALTPLLLLMVSVFIVIYRIVKGINVFVPTVPNLSESMTNAPLITILVIAFGGYAGCLLLIIPLTLICALLERNLTLYANEIKFGKRTIKYNDIRSFEISCTEDMPVLTLYLKDKPELSNSPIDFGIAPEIDFDHLSQSLQNKVSSVNP